MTNNKTILNWLEEMKELVTALRSRSRTCAVRPAKQAR